MSKSTLSDWYTIREANEDDLPSILEIFNERVLNSSSLFVYEAVPLENRQAWYRDAKAKGYPIIVVVEKETNKVIAYDYHRRGLGRVMLQKMIRIAKDMGLRSIIASITSENEPSVRLFSVFQFKLAGVFHDVGYKFGRYLDVSFYELILDTVVDKSVTVPSFKPFPWGQYKFDQ
ncbi:hypothetical protein DFQ28_000893 [Apophysomyces sp. BC1034]|nr:hypothetical protein DFQ28_000893 [Apophysomyces sp. BC1034]